MDSFNNNFSLVSEELLLKETIEQKFYGLTVILKVLNLHYLLPLLSYCTKSMINCYQMNEIKDLEYDGEHIRVLFNGGKVHGSLVQLRCVRQCLRNLNSLIFSIMFESRFR